MTSLQQFIDNAKANPGKVTFATPGIGTTPHFTAELFKKMAGIDLTHVPYRGVAAGAMSDLLTNRIDSMLNTTGSLLQAVRSGQVRGLAQSTPNARRSRRSCRPSRRPACRDSTCCPPTDCSCREDAARHREADA